MAQLQRLKSAGCVSKDQRSFEAISAMRIFTELKATLDAYEQKLKDHPMPLFLAHLIQALRCCILIITKRHCDTRE